MDVSTGEFRATEIDLAEVAAALETLNAREALRPPAHRSRMPCLKTDVEPWVFGADYAARSLCDHFHLLALDGCGLEDGRWPPARRPRCCIICARRSAPRSITWSGPHFTIAPTRWCWMRRRSAIWNWSSRCFAGESKESTLLHVLDRTRTGMGGRLLRRRLLAPSIDVAEIEARLDAVEELHATAILRGEIAKDLASILDLERLLSKLALCDRRSARSGRAGAFAGGDSVAEESRVASPRRASSAKFATRLDEVRRSSRSAFSPRSPMSRR